MSLHTVHFWPTREKYKASFFKFPGFSISLVSGRQGEGDRTSGVKHRKDTDTE